MNLLHIDASILGASSASRQLSAAIVDTLKSGAGDLSVTYRDLAKDPLMHLSGEHLAAAQGAVPETPAVQSDLAASQAVWRNSSPRMSS